MRRLGSAFASLIAIGGVAVACGSDTGIDPGSLPSTGGSGAMAGKGGGLVGGSTGVGGATGSGATGSGATGSGATGGSIVVAGSGPGTGGTSTGSGGGSAGGCVGEKATGMKGQSATVLLLIDISRSMLERAPGDTQTKLDATKEALTSAVQQLPDGLNIGLMFYPNVPVNMMPCIMETVAVPIAPLDATQRAALTASVMNVGADGSTPTHDAYQYALAQIRANTLEGQKYIVLITDGVPTYSDGCVGTGLPPGVDTQPLVDEAQAAFTTDMVKTFVIGSPGSEGAREGLSAMARVGGTGTPNCSDMGPTYCHFDMTESTDVAGALGDALGEITQQIPVDCNFDIPAPPSGSTIDINAINVDYTDGTGMTTRVGYDQTCSSGTGWRFDDPMAPTQVVFCGTLCDSVKSDAMPTVNLEFGCVRVDVPR